VQQQIHLVEQPDGAAEDAENVGERPGLGAQLQQLVGAQVRAAPSPQAQNPLQPSEELLVAGRGLGRRNGHLALQRGGSLDELE